METSEGKKYMVLSPLYDPNPREPSFLLWGLANTEEEAWALAERAESLLGSLEGVFRGLLDEVSAIESEEGEALADERFEARLTDLAKTLGQPKEVAHALFRAWFRWGKPEVHPVILLAEGKGGVEG